MNGGPLEEEEVPPPGGHHRQGTTSARCSLGWGTMFPSWSGREKNYTPLVDGAQEHVPLVGGAQEDVPLVGAAKEDVPLVLETLGSVRSSGPVLTSTSGSGEAEAGAEGKADSKGAPMRWLLLRANRSKELRQGDALEHPYSSAGETERFFYRGGNRGRKRTSRGERTSTRDSSRGKNFTFMIPPLLKGKELHYRPEQVRAKGAQKSGSIAGSSNSLHVHDIPFHQREMEEEAEFLYNWRIRSRTRAEREKSGLLGRPLVGGEEEVRRRANASVFVVWVKKSVGSRVCCISI